MDRWNQAVNACSRSPAVSRFDFSLQSTKQFRCPCQKHWLHSIATRGHTTSKEGQHCKLHCMGTLFFRRTSVLCPSPPVRVRASSGGGDESGYPRHQLLWGAALLCCSALSGHLFSLGHSGGTKNVFCPCQQNSYGCSCLRLVKLLQSPKYALLPPWEDAVLVVRHLKMFIPPQPALWGLLPCFPTVAYLI